jgi:hypothetical protein
MKQSSLLIRVMPFALLCMVLPLQAAQDTATTARKKATAGSSAKAAKPAPDNTAAAPADTGTQAAQPASAAPAIAPQQPAALEKSQPAQDQTGQLEQASPPSRIEAAPASQTENGTSVEKLRQEAVRLKAEAKVLRDMADTLNRSSDEAEEQADKAEEKAEKIEDEIKEIDAEHVGHHVRMEIEKIKRIIQADVERLKRLHGVKTSNDTNYTMQADSLDSIMAHLSVDTGQNIEKQRQLVQQIHDNSQALMEKSHEMSSKARELEEAADKREDLAEDLAGKADKLAEEQNPLPLSKRFPFHFGFQLRFTNVASQKDNQPDLLLLHGLFATYSVTPLVDVGLQDLMLYTQQTLLGTRYAITGAPSVRFAFFPLKRLQMGAVAGVSVQGRVGCSRPASVSAAPFITVFNEVWVRNHFSFSPTIRLNYAAYGPYYTAALSQHSGVLPQGALWLDIGMGYNFNF